MRWITSALVSAGDYRHDPQSRKSRGKTRIPSRRPERGDGCEARKLHGWRSAVHWVVLVTIDDVVVVWRSFTP